MRRITLLIIVLIPVFAFSEGNTSNDSFNKAKKNLLNKVYHDHRFSFYCGCPFDRRENVIPSGKVSFKKRTQRTGRVEWDHVVPAQAFGRSFKEWRDGDSGCVDRKGRAFKGRGCAGKTSLGYRYMESDMYNLVPAVGKINGDRSDFEFSEIPGEKRKYGSCDIEIEGGMVEPAPEIRGDIARIYFYMDWAYPGRGIVGKQKRKLFEAWDRQDPVDDWECERCRRIERIQGNENPIVKARCQSNEE
jgi:deoxyribonuclease-1